MSSFRQEPHPASRIFRVPLSVRLGSLFGAAAVAAVAIFLLGCALLVFLRFNWALGLFTLALAALMGGLALYVLRDLAGKWGLRVALEADGVRLDLPSGRSLIHRPPAQHLTIPYADIAGLETRLEAYGSLGMEMMQRAYVLRRKSGELIFLFEERALATGFASAMFARVVADLAARADVPVTDIGMAEGRGGLLGVWGAHAPDWAAPALSPERQRSLWARAAVTGAVAAAAATTAPGMWIGGSGRPRPGSEQGPR
jgi:hypothetical protein